MKLKRECNNPKFVVIVCCQGQQFYYLYSTLLGACCGFAYQYLTNKKYGTMNFSLEEWRIMPNIDMKGD